MKFDGIKKGFTLIEILLVIAILAVLAAIVIIAINPAKQYGESQDAQRRSDVRAILDAMHQYSIDHEGTYPGDIAAGSSTCPEDGQDICQPEVSCDGVRIDELIEDETYITSLPNDPTGATDDIIGYRIYKSSNGRISVCAPEAYGDTEINVTR